MVFKILPKIRETRNPESFEERQMRVENQTKLESENSRVYAQKLRLKCRSLIPSEVQGHWTLPLAGKIAN